MSWFKQDFIDFFNDLKENNDRDWFKANKKRYEDSVKKPFEEFIGEMILRINADDPRISMLPKDAIFRIYRDVRFSKDKTPYKIQASAIISRGGKKNKDIPGIYLEFSADYIRIYGGAYMLDKNQLLAVREHIIDETDRFNKLITNKDFVKKFGEIQGDKHKRLSPELKEAAIDQPLIFNKQFYYYAELPSKKILNKNLNLPDIIMEYYFVGKSFNQFLDEVL